VADVCGKVLVGDEIIAVNGMSVRADSLAGIDYIYREGVREKKIVWCERERVCVCPCVCVCFIAVNGLSGHTYSIACLCLRDWMGGSVCVCVCVCVCVIAVNGLHVPLWLLCI